MSDYGIMDKDRQDRYKVVSTLAAKEANKVAIGTLIVSALGTAVAAWKSKRFNALASVSTKASIPVMATLALWSIRYEVVQLDAQRNPTNWGLSEDLHDQEFHNIKKARKASKLPFYQRSMNYLYDKPFTFVAGVGFPFAAMVLRSQLANKHLTLSQKVMHSRVFAQGGVLSILLTTMVFRDYMDRRGRFVEPEEHEENEAAAKKAQVSEQEQLASVPPKNW